MKRKKIKILFLCIFLFEGLFAQSGPKGYVIISFEDTWKVSFEGKIIYPWIIPQDSINSVDFPLSYLFVSHISTKDVIDCKNGLPIDPGTIFSVPNDTFDVTVNDQIALLKDILSKNKRQIESITKKWEIGQVEKVVVYATPVIGEFCFTGYHKVGKASDRYKGKVCIPLSSFTVDKTFWENSKSKFVLHRDYSNINFKILYWLN
jgi:hypothetical protein